MDVEKKWTSIFPKETKKDFLKLFPVVRHTWRGRGSPVVSVHLSRTAHVESSNVDTSASGLRLLSAALQLPQVTHTTMTPGLFPVVEIFTPLLSDLVGVEVGVSVRFEVTTTIQKVSGNTETLGLGNDKLDLLQVVFWKFTSTFIGVNIRAFADNVCKSSSNSFNGSQGVNNFEGSIEVRREQTMNMQEVICFHYESHGDAAGPILWKNEKSPIFVGDERFVYYFFHIPLY